MKTTVLASLVMLLILPGFSSGAPKPEVPDPQSSEALRIARAAGFKDIRDIDAATLRSIDPATGSPLEAAHAMGVASGLVKATQGIPSPVEALFLFLDSSSKPRPEDARRLIAWMPKDMAPSPQDAPAVLRDIWTRAVAAALPEAKVVFVDEPFEQKPLLGRNSIQHRRYISIDMPGCDPCKISSQAMGERKLPPEVAAPVFLGSYPAYFWGGLGQGESSFGGYPWTAKDLPVQQQREFLARVSANLPSWAYLYIPNRPGEQVAPFPMILHQGKELEFVRPEIKDPTE